MFIHLNGKIFKTEDIDKILLKFIKNGDKDSVIYLKDKTTITFKCPEDNLKMEKFLKKLNGK